LSVFKDIHFASHDVPVGFDDAVGVLDFAQRTRGVERNVLDVALEQLLRAAGQDKIDAVAAQLRDDALQRRAVLQENDVVAAARQIGRRENRQRRGGQQMREGRWRLF
jgi:uncharacterized membrane-anchored protein